MAGEEGMSTHIKGRPRYAQSYEFQDDAQELVVQTDGAWALCKSIRGSYSEGLVFRGRHLLHHCCRVQASVTLSTSVAR